MKRLILVRHAKSSWSESSLPDKDRPLNDRGHEAAPKIGRWLASKGYQPDEVISSAALRCRETWAGILGQLNPVSNVRFEDYLYLATDAEMLDTLRTASGDTVLMIGHMPGIGDLARGLRQDPPPKHSLFAKYPTGAATVLDFQIDDWAEAQFGSARFEAYVAPADL
ncbi:MAG: histidine phosphatase family protein [Rhodobacteraceae bacterium]|nr:histidine phosphatase family protein [Paracoccaceae bacterium]